MTENLEHAFALRLAVPVEIVLDPTEHLRYEWLPLQAAAERAASHTNRAAIELIGRFIASC